MEDLIVDIDLGRQGQVVNKRDDILLVDADTLVFATCATLATESGVLPRHMYSDYEWDKITSDAGYFEDDGVICSIDLEEAFSHSYDKLQGMLDETGCSDYELHFTRGRDNFRYTKVSRDYKGNRTGRPPYGLGMLKDMWSKAYPDKVFQHYEFEADDIVVAKKKLNPDKYLLASVDKDVLNTLEGEAFNYYSSSLYDIPMKFIYTPAIDALTWHYKQVIMGDAGDNVIGIKGMGKVKTARLFKDVTTHKECWDIVVKLFEDEKTILKDGRDASIIDAITNMRLVNMHQLHYIDGKWEVILWKPEF